MKTENKLIAEFMGMEEERHTDGRYLFTTDLEEEKGIDTRFTEELYFHISWDWLMPVVDKMNTTELWEEYDISYLATYLVSTDINATYNAVVEFINEYNKNK